MGNGYGRGFEVEILPPQGQALADPEPGHGQRSEEGPVLLRRSEDELANLIQRQSWLGFSDVMRLRLDRRIRK